MNFFKSVKKTFELLGFDIRRIPPTMQKYSYEYIKGLIGDVHNIHYGCGNILFDEWINIDLACRAYNTNQLYIDIDLLNSHPFPDNWFCFGFSEDFIEHLNQADQIIFLTEVFRTFKKGGILRLSFPGLEGVLNKHYKKPDYHVASLGKNDAYAMWGHLHFCSREELKLICEHIGFKKIGSSRNRVGKKQHKIGIDWLWITRNRVFIGIRNLV